MASESVFATRWPPKTITRRRLAVIAAGVLIVGFCLVVVNRALKNSGRISQQNATLAAFRAKGPIYALRGWSLLGNFDPALSNGPVTKLHLSGPAFGDADAERLSQFPNLTELSFDRTSMTDDSLEYLEAHTKLKRLNLADTQITDDGLKNLRHLQFLESIDLSRTRISNEGLKILGKFPALTDISAGRCSNLTAEGVKKFRDEKQGRPRLHY